MLLRIKTTVDLITFHFHICRRHCSYILCIKQDATVILIFSNKSNKIIFSCDIKPFFLVIYWESYAVSEAKEVKTTALSYRRANYRGCR